MGIKIMNKRAKVEIIHYLRATKDRIVVKAGACRFNYRCQYNAVHEAINNKESKIAMCMYIENDYPIIHFINVNKKGEYTDNTLGNWVQNYEFYFIKFIDEADFFNVDNIFIYYRKELRKNLSFFTWLFSDIVF